MAADTKISWATHTFNPWIGCAKVASGCANCYAESMAGRLGVAWGPHGTRRRTARSTWKQVEKWNRQAACTCNASTGTCDPCLNGSPRVFPSLCDPFEDWGGFVQHSNQQVRDHGTLMCDVRRDFFALIDRCQNLDFLLLTKRLENIRRMWPAGVPSPSVELRNKTHFDSEHPNDIYALHRSNVWLLFSASDQESLDAGLPHLLACRDLTPVIGLSLEPLIGPVDLSGFFGCVTEVDSRGLRNLGSNGVQDSPWGPMGARPFVIVGGESGPRHRPMDLAWLESIADQCASAGVKLWVKQDCGRKPGQQGRIPDDLWARKELPK